MKNLVVFILLIISSTPLLSQNYKKVKIYITDSEEIINLMEKGFALDEARLDAKENSLSLYLSDKEFREFQGLNLKYEILIDDWDKYYKFLSSSSNKAEEEFYLQKSKNIFGVTGFSYGSMGGHYTLQEVLNKIDSIHLQYPSITTDKFEIGTSVENRPIYAIKISDNPDLNENEPEVLFTALTHAREPQGIMTTIYFMYYLLENYGTDPEATYLINNRQIYFIPVVNPDGYEYNRSGAPNGGGMWRKNRRSPDGVDLNRNYGYQWGYDNVGSSFNQYSEVYRGTGPFSEPETRTVRDFCNLHNFKVAFNFHTYGNLLVIPWGFSNSETPDSLIYRDFSNSISNYNKYTWGVGTGTVGYITNGDADDWMYGEQTSKGKIISFTPEVGSDEDGFWAPKNRILPLAQVNVLPNLYLCWVPGGFVNIKSYSFDKNSFNPGDDVQLSVVFKNEGLSQAKNVTANLTSLSSDIVVNNSFINLGSVSERSEVNAATPFTLTILSSVNPQNKIKIVVSTYIEGIPMHKDTISISLGAQEYTFADTTNIINSLWSTSGNGTWSTITSTYYSQPNCYTDSKSGDYSNDANVVMTLKDQIDLDGIINPIFTFWTKYDIENNYDYGQVKFSTDNSSTWFSLPGRYSNISTGTYQPAGEYLYDGIQSNWIQEEINLSSLTGKKIKIRFEFHSDTYLVKDGWYIDDIGIYQYVVLPVELISFNAIADNNFVLLNWTTGSELNNKGFQIQRSADKEKWENLSFLEGKGTTNQSNEYTYKDYNPLADKSFYRLLQIDYNGTTKESKTVEVFIKNDLIFLLEQNYPNPFNSTTNISFSITEGSLVYLAVYNSLGEKIKTLLNEKLSFGNHEVKFDAIDFPSGIYYYKLITKQGSISKKMIYLK